MPGLVGIVGLAGPDDAARRFDTALGRMRRFGGVSAETHRFLGDRCLVAHVSLAAAAKARSADGQSGPAQGPAVFFHGVLHNADALRGEAATSAAGGVEATLAAL